MSPRPVVLCILDGWGLRSDLDNNAIAQANTPTFDRLMQTCPTGRLNASERFVGLPEGQMGNSEVGHMNLGAGRIVVPDLPRIDNALLDGSLAAKPGLHQFIATLKASGGAAHLLGLMSDGGVHSHQDHIVGTAKLIAAQGVPVILHVFTDGRDTPPQSALTFLSQVEAALGGVPGVRIGTLSGRFFAMDRDKRWDRVEAAYRAIVSAQGKMAESPKAAIEASYAAGELDEFIQPTVIGAYAGMADGDGLMMVNFRADRARELLTALADPAFDGFARSRTPKFAAMLGMVEYSSALNVFFPALFPPEDIPDTLGEVLAKAGKTQLRIAETEKYAHVTFFFNGGVETVFPGEERILVPSPKVKTYDLQPAMSAVEVTDKLVAAIEGGQFDAIVVNYANTDMVGHSGILSAAIEAVETVDACLARLEAAVVKAGGAMLVTADHGNAEQMIDPITREPHTAHTLNLVPTILVNAPAGVKSLREGALADVAPTLLALIGLPQPAVMTGISLLSDAAPAQAAAE
ncbi:phosphoglyceromutase [Elstera litoralis]|uniref:2,3-bisphosphoglycerate-independent phosphoglycerate mutase n=1 Tax=Elstera litoralis TaxID=552518 RepID=A0A0F3IRE2_9PROT|nr:2,3-bisphosphoglycerate-independent phosphoglycerate mutase [Elstera litoralis]KJV09108.1 phosphoglyceromutase [Elstera litoralis]